MVGVSTYGEGRTLSHEEGIQQAAGLLGYVDYRFAEGMLGEPVEAEVDKMITQEARKVILFDSFEHRVQAEWLAKKHPDAKFLAFGARPVPPNLGAFDARTEQGWYVAGQTAAVVSTSKRLGFVGDMITPESVRAINAFTRGAQSVEPSTKVEVRWLGFWFDYNTSRTFHYKPVFAGPASAEASYFAEEYAAALLIDAGADVIAHTGETRRVNRMVEQAGPMFKSDGVTPLRVHTFASHNRLGYQDGSTHQPMKTTIGAVYWNWTPVYSRLFEDLAADKWTPFDINAPMTEPLGSSVVGLSRNPDSTAGLDSAAFELRLLGQAKAGYGSVFKGPYETTGQRAAVPDGQGLDDKELRQMCWFVKGVVEKVNPMLPASGDHDALVPTTAHPPPTEEKPESGTWVFLTLPGVPRGVTWQCDLNQIPE